MDTLLFSSRSIWTMVHGIFLGGGSLLGVAAALFALVAMRTTSSGPPADGQSRSLAWLLAATALLLWAAVFVGTYVSFPPYRATPPDGLSELAAFPRALIRSDSTTVWLHSYAMESKEHMPWMAAMLVTAVAFVAAHYRSQLLRDERLHRTAVSLLAISTAIVAAVSLLGILVNKVAPLE